MGLKGKPAVKGMARTPSHLIRRSLLAPRRHGKYDAAYLELAIREGLPLATLDQQPREAAARVGVPEFQP